MSRTKEGFIRHLHNKYVSHTCLNHQLQGYFHVLRDITFIALHQKQEII